MSEGDPLQNPTQEATGNPEEPEVEPTAVANEAGGPSNTLLEQDTKDPIMQLVVHNFDRMNAMYKAFTQKLKSTPKATMVVPLKVVPMPLTDVVKRRSVVNSDFYHEPFIFKESERDVRDLVASLFTARIRDYDMSYGIKVPTNLRTYDGTTDPDDHLTVFIGTINMHKL
ncbi:hypothetical protein Tco_1300915 [Tanacetum coccineum]